MTEWLHGPYSSSCPPSIVSALSPCSSPLAYCQSSDLNVHNAQSCATSGVSAFATSPSRCMRLPLRYTPWAPAFQWAPCTAPGPGGTSSRGNPCLCQCTTEYNACGAFRLSALAIWAVPHAATLPYRKASRWALRSRSYTCPVSPKALGATVRNSFMSGTRPLVTTTAKKPPRLPSGGPY